MKTKLDHIEKEIEKNEGRFVTLPHFDAVVEPIRKTLDAVQKDIKEILRAVVSYHKDNKRD